MPQLARWLDWRGCGICDQGWGLPTHTRWLPTQESPAWYPNPNSCCFAMHTHRKTGSTRRLRKSLGTGTSSSRDSTAMNSLEAADSEASIHPDRLALLSVVRGLEALEQPSKVNLVTTSRYVSRGLKYGLNTWRRTDYCWESFGEQKPVRNADLWQRVDQALEVSRRYLSSDSTPIDSARGIAWQAWLPRQPRHGHQHRGCPKVASNRRPYASSTGRSARLQQPTRCSRCRSTVDWVG